MLQTPIPITDDRGKCLISVRSVEPNPGSVVLTDGEWGTAWQRFFHDGLWHKVGGGRAFTWARLLEERNLVLVYDARERLIR